VSTGTDGLSFPTSLGTSSADQIRLLGQDLTADLMGKVGFGELAFWLVAMRRPTPSETRVFEAVLVALADHGFTPTAMAARLTYLSAPDSVQGALAAGLLGGGSRFLGVTEDCGQFLDAVLTEAGEIPTDDAGFDALALAAVTRAKAERKFIPGLGHPVHKVLDPRTPRLIEIAEEEGLRGPHLRLFEAIGRVHPQVLGRTLPLNGAGVCGAALAYLGFEADMLRGFALLARAAGCEPAEVILVSYGPPVSPHLAAQLTGESGPTLDQIAGGVRSLNRPGVVTVVEGVGGLLVPLGPDVGVRELAAALGLPLVIAARPGLGTINHTLLTLEAARSARLAIAGVVLTPWPSEPSVMERSNRETIERLGEVEVAALPPIARADPELLGTAGEALPLERWLAAALA